MQAPFLAACPQQQHAASYTKVGPHPTTPPRFPLPVPCIAAHCVNCTLCQRIPALWQGPPPSVHPPTVHATYSPARTSRAIVQACASSRDLEPATTTGTIATTAEMAQQQEAAPAPIPKCERLEALRKAMVRVRTCWHAGERQASTQASSDLLPYILNPAYEGRCRWWAVCACIHTYGTCIYHLRVESALTPLQLYMCRPVPMVGGACMRTLFPPRTPT